MERAREIVDGYAPLKVTLRQVMYRLVSEGVLPHTSPMYRRLSAQLAQARREGLGSKLRKGEAGDADISSFQNVIDGVKEAGKSAGAEVTDKVPRVLQLGG
ncbi:hypothetical protein AB0D94_32940 [Streptomyces sp. NPDC048255]|uniref:hypothetical protein n=1 Tax=Streptomyces sp. NPDC048255 TaxID=3154713 RepID=UPI0034106354